MARVGKEEGGGGGTILGGSGPFEAQMGRVGRGDWFLQSCGNTTLESAVLKTTSILPKDLFRLCKGCGDLGLVGHIHFDDEA